MQKNRIYQNEHRKSGLEKKFDEYLNPFVSAVRSSVCTNADEQIRILSEKSQKR
jgi:hypothetical protein